MNENYSKLLSGRGIRPSYQRIKILDYLATHPCHPYAEQIYNEIHKEIPTISKSTVYSTLKAFVDSGILREITIEDLKVRYEYNLKNHGHFKCRVCEKIYDFDIDSESIRTEALEGFKIEAKDVFFKGICIECLNNNNK